MTGYSAASRVFFSDDVRRIDADAEGRHVMVFAETEFQIIVKRLARAFGGAVQQGEIQRAFHRERDLGDGLQNFHAAGNVGKGEFGSIERLDDGQHIFD